MKQSGLLQDTTEKTYMILYWGTLTKDFYINSLVRFSTV